MSISGLEFDFGADQIINAHKLAQLHSQIVIYQKGSNIAELDISDSHFVGSTYAILVSGGSLSVYDSYFELNTIPIEAQLADIVWIDGCVFDNFGLYSGPYPDEDSDPSGVRLISIVTGVEIYNNGFKGYAPDGLLQIERSTNVVLQQNVFGIDTDGLLYEVSAESIGFESYAAALILKLCDTTTVTENVFMNNSIDYTTPWIHFKSGSVSTCLAGNR